MSTSADDSKKREHDFHSDDGDSGPESGDGLHSDDDGSAQGIRKSHSPMPTFVPYSEKQRLRLTTFNGAIAGPSQTLKLETADEDDVIDSMSSYQDLKYLVKSLRKASSQSWVVFLNAKWSASRRKSFLQWTTETLGFSCRLGGMSTAFIQVSKKRGPELLELLELSLEACKERGINSKTPTNGDETNNNNKTQFDFSGMQPVASAAKVSNSFAMTPKE